MQYAVQHTHEDDTEERVICERIPPHLRHEAEMAADKAGDAAGRLATFKRYADMPSQTKPLVEGVDLSQPLPPLDVTKPKPPPSPLEQLLTVVGHMRLLHSDAVPARVSLGTLRGQSAYAVLLQVPGVELGVDPAPERPHPIAWARVTVADVTFEAAYEVKP